MSARVNVARMSLLDDPRKRAKALPVRRASTRPPADAPARADGLAVACLKVAAGDPPWQRVHAPILLASRRLVKPARGQIRANLRARLARDPARAQCRAICDCEQTELT